MRRSTSLTCRSPTSIIKAFSSPSCSFPTTRNTTPETRDGFRLRLHVGLGFFVLATALKATAVSSPPPEPSGPAPSIAGEWIGELDGEWVSWNFGDEGKAHVNGRNAQFTVAHDTLRVTFEAPMRATADALPEVAIYRFLASDPSMGPPRLFVYGFDLGRQGVWLRLAPEEPPLPEDTAPPAPPDAKPHAAPSAAPTAPASMPGNGQTAAAAPNPPRP